MKKTLSLVLALLLALSLLAACDNGGSTPAATTSAGGAATTSEGSAAPEANAWAPSQDINWIVTSSPGGGSDIYTRMISDIMTRESIVSNTFLVTNKTDGGGEIGRNEVSNTREGNEADHTLLTFNSGDLMPMVQNTPNRVQDFTPIAIMAVDKQLMFIGEHAKYATFLDGIEAAESGTPVIIGGSKGDDIATYKKLLEEIGLTEDQMPYITYDSTGDAITAILGGHVDFVISKPAASSEYVEAEKLTPVLALSTERYTGNLADAPTLSKIGDYEDVEVPVWRGVAGPKNMSPEAAAFWSEALRQVSESQAWADDYIAKNMLIPQFMGHEEAKAFMEQYQTDFMAQEGIS